MRVLSVSELKNEQRDTPHRDYPAKGTMGDRVIQRLMTDPGHAVDVSDLRGHASNGSFNGTIESLRNMYGMDIRSTKPKGKKMILAGEWFGSHYTDYCAAAFKAGEK